MLCYVSIRLHEIKNKNRKYNIKTCPTTVQHDTTKKKKTPFKKSQLLSRMISNNIFQAFFDNNINVKVDNTNIKTKQIQCKFKFKLFLHVVLTQQKHFFLVISF